MDHDEIKNEIARFMGETTPIDESPKSISSPPRKLKKYIVALLAAVAITMLSVTYEPEFNQVTFYPIGQPTIQIMMKKATAEGDWPSMWIKIGPGCSTKRPIKPVTTNQHIEI